MKEIIFGKKSRRTKLERMKQSWTALKILKFPYFLFVLITCFLNWVSDDQTTHIFLKKSSFLKKNFWKSSKTETKVTLNKMQKQAVFLQQCYLKDLDENMDKELFHFISHISKKKEFQEIIILEPYLRFYDLKLESVHPYVDVIFRLALCTPISKTAHLKEMFLLRKELQISSVL